jgi:hypothetical protein
MTKTEKIKIQEFVSNLTDKDYSSANKALHNLVAEKLKNRIRDCVDNDKTKKVAKKNK